MRRNIESPSKSKRICAANAALDVARDPSVFLMRGTI